MREYRKADIDHKNRLTGNIYLILRRYCVFWHFLCVFACQKKIAFTANTVFYYTGRSFAFMVNIQSIFLDFMFVTPL